MSRHSDRADRFNGTSNWLLGGAIGGVVGSALFGGLLWLADPAIVTETIPAIYGLEPGSVGWAFHLTHGLVLGIIFGFSVTRQTILGALSSEVDTDFIAAMGMHTRCALAGIVYGLAVWAVLPVLGSTIAIAAGPLADPGFPIFAAESLVGHLLYGFLLGGLFSVFVDVETRAQQTETPFEKVT